MRYRIQYWRWLTLAAKGRGLADRGLRLARGLRDRAVAEFDIVQSSRHVLQERRTLRRCERGREFTQERGLLVGEVNHGRGRSLGACSFSRAMARSTACTKRASILSSCSRDHPPTTSSPGCDGVWRPWT